VSDLKVQKRKINLMIAAAGLNIGGAEVVIKHLVQTIDRERFNITVCCIKVSGVIGDELSRDGVDIVTLSNPSESRVNYFTFRKLLRIIRSKQIDIVHTHTTDALADAAICKLFMPKFRLIHTFHFGNYPNLRSRYLWMEQVFSRLADRLIAVGEVQRRQIMDVFCFHENRIGRVWNGIAFGSNESDGEFRMRVGAENCILIGTIATLIEQKGLHDLLAVARQVRDTGRKVRFVVVGDGHLRQELEAMRRALGLEETVVFAGWVMNAARVALPAFDVFFQPSLWEAMSIVILEAMAAGKPIVATRVGENTRIIENEVDGFLVKPHDVNGMAEALGRLIDDAGLRCRLGNAAAEKVAQQFTVEHMTQAYEQIYLETLGGMRI